MKGKLRDRMHPSELDPGGLLSVDPSTTPEPSGSTKKTRAPSNRQKMAKASRKENHGRRGRAKNKPQRRGKRR